MGVFARRKLKVGEDILLVEGRRFHYTTLLRIRGSFLDNCYRLSENYFLSPEGTLGEFFNHSCSPNTRVEKRGTNLYIVAVKDIVKGEEVVFDYSTLIARDDVWSMLCNCGEKVCRKVVLSYKKLPKPLLREYLKSSIIPVYIQRI